VWKELLEVWQAHLVSGTRKSWRTHGALCPEASGGKQYSLVPQLRCSPDLAQVDILLFPTLKVHLKTPRSQLLTKVPQKALGQLTQSSSKYYIECREKWKPHWDRYISTGGAILKGIMFNEICLLRIVFYLISLRKVRVSKGIIILFCVCVVWCIEKNPESTNCMTDFCENWF